MHACQGARASEQDHLKNGARGTGAPRARSRQNLKATWCRQLSIRLRPWNFVSIGFLSGQQAALKVFSLQVGVGIRHAFGRGSNGELETFDRSVSKLAGPHDVFGPHHGHDAAAQGHKVGIASHLDRLRRADLNARKTFPTLVRLLVVRLHLVWIQNHQIVGANVHTCSFVPAFATIAFFSDYETRHIPSLPVRVKWDAHRR